jgi:hypothetical protein
MDCVHADGASVLLGGIGGTVLVTVAELHFMGMVANVLGTGFGLWFALVSLKSRAYVVSDKKLACVCSSASLEASLTLLSSMMCTS